MCSSDRNGITITSGNAPVDRRVAHVAEPQVDARRPASSACSRATSSIPSDESTPITWIPTAAIGIAIRPVPTPSSTTGPPDRTASST